jgi:hypothetical protein
VVGLAIVLGFGLLLASDTPPATTAPDGGSDAGVG